MSFVKQLSIILGFFETLFLPWRKLCACLLTILKSTSISFSIAVAKCLEQLLVQITADRIIITYN